MRTCRVCGTLESVSGMRGPPTCPRCRSEKQAAVKRRYRQSRLGLATTQAYESREAVKAKRRKASRSAAAKARQRRYEATEKGKATRRKTMARYRATPKAKQTSARRHALTKDDPARREQRRGANSRYRKTEKGKALSRRQNARRRGAILSTENPLTAADWLDIVKRAKGRCYYCKRKRKLTLDHVIPLSKGGKHDKSNVVPACGPCNSIKRDRLILLC